MTLQDLEQREANAKKRAGDQENDRRKEVSIRVRVRVRVGLVCSQRAKGVTGSLEHQADVLPAPICVI